ncbi:heptaprenyl diphosphate synthase component 1 [Camelliibacillus cellulosilyticus]|uniref:Heptaprenyl diphosphate synthase component 1 n=1 Tax=Camelliibacillus cellulosilyticus TaxID=2174486 RepID=A0ABV9GKN4_9BACL
MNISKEISDIISNIDEKTRHPYLDRFVRKPEPDKDKIAVLLSLFKANGLYKNVCDYITAIMIVQMALDMHDKVTVEPVRGSDVRSRQLIVLAGDYYSSQYYRILSKLGDIPMIRLTADAIRQINEQKNNLLKGEWEWARLFEQIKSIETALLTKMANILGLSHWSDFIVAYFSYKRILKEKQSLINGKVSTFFQPLFAKKAESRKSFLQLCDRWLTELRMEIEADLGKHPLLAEQLSLITPTWAANVGFGTKKVAEEG